MREFAELINSYFSSLNETEGERRRMLIEEVWSENGKFISPIGEVTGYDAIDVQVQGFQRQFPDAEVRRNGEIEVLHGKYVRFAFEALRSDGEAFIAGVDFGIVADGKLNVVAGFFDFVLSPTER